MQFKRSFLACLALAAMPAFSHHSFDAEYDSKNIATLTGAVTRVEWINPHAFLYVNVKDEAGTVKNFRFELGPPYALVRGGWKKDTVKVGDTVTVSGGAMAKDPANNWVGAVPSTSLVLSNGQKMIMR
jgi:Family of unknown function (DUF6152)